MENSTKPVPKIVLTGPACLFKTSTLKKMQSLGVGTIVGDYSEHSKAEPVFKNKLGKSAFELEYQLYVLARMKPGYVHDRFPLDSLIYMQVFDVYYGAKTMEEAKAALVDVCRRTVIPLMNTGEYIVVVLYASKDKYDIVHQRMQQRLQDPMDELTVKYVEIQNELFLLVAKECGWKTFQVDDYLDISGVIEYLRITYNKVNGTNK